MCDETNCFFCRCDLASCKAWDWITFADMDVPQCSSCKAKSDRKYSAKIAASNKVVPKKLKRDVNGTKARTRGWCVTIQENTVDHQVFAMGLYELDENCIYACIGCEKATRTGKSHLQCYFYYRNPMRWTEAQKRFAPHHLEAQKSKSNVAAYEYCMKDGDFIEFGDRPRQGQRTDLEVIRHDLERGVPMKDIARQNFSQWCFHRRSFEEYVRLNAASFDETRVILYEHLKPLYAIRQYYQSPDRATSLIGLEKLFSHEQFYHALFSRAYSTIYMGYSHGLRLELDKAHIAYEILDNADHEYIDNLPPMPE